MNIQWSKTKCFFRCLSVAGNSAWWSVMLSSLPHQWWPKISQVNPPLPPPSDDLLVASGSVKRRGIYSIQHACPVSSAVPKYIRDGGKLKVWDVTRREMNVKRVAFSDVACYLFVVYSTIHLIVCDFVSVYRHSGQVYTRTCQWQPHILFRFYSFASESHSSMQKSTGSWGENPDAT